MASRYQSSLNNSVLTHSKVLKISSHKQQKNTPSNKKLFTRKPLNNSQNCSRFISTRLKTYQDQQYCPENLDLSNSSLNNSINPSKNIKFVSSKSTQSLEKLLACSSVQQLPTLSQLSPKKQAFDQDKLNKFNSKINKIIQSPKFTEDFKFKFSQLDIIEDQEKEDFNTKDLLGSTQLSSNDNLCNDDSNEDDFKLNQLQRSKRNQTLSFNYPRNIKKLHKECPTCLVNAQKLKELNDLNTKLQESLQEKQFEIRKLNEKNEKLSRNLQDSETLKINLEHEIKLLKEKESFVSSQKDEIDSAFKKLQLSFSKLNQEVKYKELELNIHKIYKTKSHEMEMKVETLKNELNRAKKCVTKLMTSKSSVNLLERSSKPDLRVVGDFKRQNSQKMLKQPKLARVYREDSIFSLSSQECD